MPKKSKKQPKTALPSAADLADFLAESPGRPSKRDVARALGVKGKKNKIRLKDMLKAARPQQLPKTGNLPPVLEIEVTRIDADGDAFGRPVLWNEGHAGPAPLMPVIAGKAVPGIGDRVLAKIEAYPGGEPYKHQARVLRDLAKDAPRIVGLFRKTSSGGRIIPSGKKERDDLVVHRDDEGEAKDGELVVAELTRHRGRGPAQARVRERLGAHDDPRNTSLIAIHTHGIPDVFPASVEDEVKRLKPFKMDHREDLRDVPLITIDPVDARDHDDAIWAAPDDAPDNPGGHKLIVAIADVAAYVSPASGLDREARKRGNSTYFPDRVVPMLPERISNDLCSLKEGLDRPALACFMTIDATGKKKSHRFVRAVIRVAAGLAYETAQAVVDERKVHELRDKVLKPLWAAFASLCKARDARGPLDLDLPERKIILDKDGHIDKIIVPPRLDAHRLVEEFMILANVAAAEQLNAKRSPLLFRIHEEPSMEKLRALEEFLRSSNIPFSLGQVVRSKHFNRVLQQAKGTPNQQVVNEVVLRSQAQAVYSPKNAGHFGLSLANYAHFTSPIRRYADLIVHRALIKSLKLGSDGLSEQDIAQLEDTAEKISAAERRSMLAERETNDRMVAAHLSEQLGAHFKGRISGVVSAGLFVVLKDTGADGFIPASSLGREFFAFVPAQHALVGASSGETYQLGDEVDVRLMEVAPIRGGLRFEMQSGGKPGKKPDRHSRPMKRKSKGKRR